MSVILNTILLVVCVLCLIIVHHLRNIQLNKKAREAIKQLEYVPEKEEKIDLDACGNKVEVTGCGTVCSVSYEHYYKSIGV